MYGLVLRVYVCVLCIESIYPGVRSVLLYWRLEIRYYIYQPASDTTLLPTVHRSPMSVVVLESCHAMHVKTNTHVFPSLVGAIRSTAPNLALLQAVHVPRLLAGCGQQSLGSAGKIQSAPGGVTLRGAVHHEEKNKETVMLE